jgi:hypothetical protein
MKLLFEEIGSSYNGFDFYSGGDQFECRPGTGNALSGFPSLSSDTECKCRQRT